MTNILIDWDIKLLPHKVSFYGNHNSNHSKSVKEQIVLFIRKSACRILISQYLLAVVVVNIVCSRRSSA